MTGQYETVFIVTPVLSDEQVKETVKKFKDFILKNDGKIIHEEHWGLRKLAYPIQKKSTGYYSLFEFSCESKLIEKLEVEYKRDERIMRFLTVKLDKFAVEYNERKRTQKANAKKVEA